MFRALDKVVPTDRSKNIDEVVGDFYSGYDAALTSFVSKQASSSNSGMSMYQRLIVGFLSSISRMRVFSILQLAPSIN